MTYTADIVIPVLNEQETLERQIDKMVRYLQDHSLANCKVELVIGDNGSDDHTPELGKQLQLKYADYVRYQRSPDRGVGRALKQAWGTSSADIVGYMDLDLATDLQHLPDALSALVSEQYDFVYGSRLHKESVVVGRSIKRSAVSRIFNSIIQSYFSTDISDAMCGFKFLRRSVFDELCNAGAKSNGWFFCAEILIAADALGLNIYEIPVRWSDTEESKVKIPSLALEYLEAMRKLKRRIREI